MKLRGFDVRDADHPITLAIKKVDARGADRKNPERCVIARACKRDMEDVKEALVHLSRVYVRRGGDNYWTRYQLPRVLRTEVIVFDRGGQAFQSEDVYDLRPPTPGNSLGGSHRKAHPPTGPKLKTNRSPSHYTENVRVSALQEF